MEVSEIIGCWAQGIPCWAKCAQFSKNPESLLQICQFLSFSFSFLLFPVNLARAAAGGELTARRLTCDTVTRRPMCGAAERAAQRGVAPWRPACGAARQPACGAALSGLTRHDGAAACVWRSTAGGSTRRGGAVAFGPCGEIARERRERGGRAVGTAQARWPC